MSRVIRAILPLFVGLSLSTSAWARDTGRITGKVTDEATQKPVPGATVTVTSPSLLGEMTEFTDENGHYLITELPPGEYLMRVYYSDLVVERPGIRVEVDKTFNVSIAIPSEKAKTETITITERAPTVDVATTQRQTSITSELVRRMPVAGRNYESVLTAAPGATTDDVGYSFNGSTGPENNFLMNGFNITSISYGLVGTPMSLEFIEATEIITGGYNAEYGRSTGGVINLVTKSGSNELHGSVFMGFTPLQLTPEAGGRLGEAVASLRYPSRWREADIGFTLGGPVVKDRVWFFGGFHPQYSEQKYTRYFRTRLKDKIESAEGSVYEGDTESDPLKLCPPWIRARSDDLCAAGGFLSADIPGSEKDYFSHTWLFNYMGKFDIRLDDDNRLSLEYVGSPTTFEGILGNPLEQSGTSGVGLNSDPGSYRYTESIPGHDVSLHLTSKLAERKLILDFSAGFHTQGFKVSPQNLAGRTADTNLRSLYLFEPSEACRPQVVRLDDGRDVAFDPCPVQNYSYGGFGFYNDITESRFATSLYATYLAQLGGSHEFKVGGDFEVNSYRDLRAYTSGEAYHVRSRDRGRRQLFATQDEETGAVIPMLNGFEASTKSFREMLFVRDSYSPEFVPGLTLNAGIRWDLEQLKDVDGNTAAAISDNFGPRLGFVYDFTGKGQSKIFGHFGRFYEAIPLDITDRAFSAESITIQNTGVCGRDAKGRIDPAQCPFENPLTVDNAFVLGGEKTPISPQLKGQYSDEFEGGVEYDVGWDLVLGATFVHRNLGRVIEDISVDGANTYFIANPGDPANPGTVAKLQREVTDVNEQLKNTTDADQIEALTKEKTELLGQLALLKGAAKFPRPERYYNAGVFTARKRLTDRLQLVASYTYSRTTGNYPGLYSPSNGQLDPNISSQYDLAGLLLNRDGPLPNDRPHNFKLSGSYFVPTGENEKDGITIGLSINGQSGVPIEVLGAHPVYGDLESFILPRGSGGRTPFLTSVNAKLLYTIDAIEIGWEVFNLLNRRGVVAVDEEYTADDVLPIVNGTIADLKGLKTTEGGTPRRNPNFGQATAYQQPLSMRFTARVNF